MHSTLESIHGTSQRLGLTSALSTAHPCTMHCSPLGHVLLASGLARDAIGRWAVPVLAATKPENKGVGGTVSLRPPRMLWPGLPSNTVNQPTSRTRSPPELAGSRSPGWHNLYRTGEGSGSVGRLGSQSDGFNSLIMLSLVQ